MFLPWIAQYIKSLEINGIGKVELIDMKKKNQIEKNMESTNIPNTNLIDPNKYSFYRLRKEDTKLALAALRIEIEEKLNKIADKNGVDVYHMGLRQMTDILNQKGLLDMNEVAIISDMTGILNKAVHSQIKIYEFESIQWVIDMGLKLISSLEEKCK